MSSMTTAELAEKLGEVLLANHWTITTAESCTGGLISAAITEISGSSGWFEQAAICYSNAAKSALLGVDPGLISAEGAVSERVAIAMAEGALQRSGANIAVAVTGVAGPTGGTESKPVGTVWLAWAIRERASYAQLEHFAGDRTAVRAATVQVALQGCLKQITA